MRKFILASASPRRRKLLSEAGFKFEVLPSAVDEKTHPDLSPSELCVALAADKARSVYAIKKEPVLGADTIVVLDGEVLGKPADRSINAQYLKRLSGRVHQVYTGFCLIADGKERLGFDVADVKFNTLGEDVIAAYVASGNGLDKAGGYGIQDEFELVEKISGSYTCVVGLPMEKVSQLLKEVL